MTRSAGTAEDVLRQVLNVVGAVAQVATGFFVANGVGDVANENRSVILPAGYAFAIWSLIFLLFAAYAVYQALPAHRTDRLPRRIGWWTAAAAIGNGVWTLLFPNRQFVLAQILIVAIAGCAIVAFLRYASVTAERAPSTFERVVIGPAVGLLAGWITAATFVGVAGTLVALGWEAGGDGARVGGVGLLLFGGGVAVTALLATRRGEPEAWLAYGGAVIWALIAVAVNNPPPTGLVAVAALAIAAVVVIVMVVAFTSRGRSRGMLRPSAA